MKNLAIIDTETTGFSKIDRILEIGIILIDDGNIVHEWESIINPLRDVSNSSIHGIDPEMFAMASTFEELQGQISKLLHNRIIVAHNLSFDQRMLNQEYLRLRKEVDWGVGICTLKATKLKLEQAATKFKIKNSLAHSALSDAKVVAGLINNLDFNLQDFSPTKIPLSSENKVARVLTRDAFSVSKKSEKKSIEKFFKNASISNYEGKLLEYIDVLSNALSDLNITNEELKRLNEFYTELNLKSQDIQIIHEDFISSLTSSALRDGILSESEFKIILELANKLGVEIDLNNLKPADKKVFEIIPGMKICFTGTYVNEQGIEIDKSKLKQIAKKIGLIPVDSITKKNCDLLVASDIKSMSGKSQKARNFDIPIISTKDFLDKYSQI